MSEVKDNATLENAALAAAELRISFLEKRLEQASRFEEIGMLAGVVAHDLNNILTPVFGYSTILRRDMDKDHPLSKAVGAIEKSAERAALLIGKLLACTRQMDTVIVPFDIVEIVDRLLENIAGRVGTIHKSCPAALPEVLGDPHQIELALRAVAENAIEAMAEGGRLSVALEQVTIDDAFSRHHPPSKPGPHLCITIADTGRGMTGDVLARAFEPYFSTKPSSLCAGIGLTITQTILKRSRGAIDLESIEGKGTTVKIYLPLKQS